MTITKRSIIRSGPVTNENNFALSPTPWMFSPWQFDVIQHVVFLLISIPWYIFTLFIFLLRPTLESLDLQIPSSPFQH